MNKILFYFTILLLFCGGFLLHEKINEQRDSNSKIRLELFRGIPEKFIQYGPELKRSDSDVWEATIRFDANDIPGYIGDYFSTKVFLRYPVREADKLGCFEDKVNALKNSDLYLRSSPYLDFLLLEDGREIKAMITDFAYKRKPDLNKKSLISTGGKDIAIHENLFAGDDKKSLNSVDKYSLRFRDVGCAEFNITHSSVNHAARRFFFVSKFFIFDA